MGKLVKILLALLLVGAVLNDVGRYFTTWYQLDNVAEEAARRAAGEARNGTRTSAGMKAVRYAEENGMRVYGYDQEDERVFVWTEADVTGTWLVGPVKAWRAKKPLASPFVVQEKTTALIQ